MVVCSFRRRSDCERRYALKISSQREVPRLSDEYAWVEIPRPSRVHRCRVDLYAQEAASKPSRNLVRFTGAFAFQRSCGRYGAALHDCHQGSGRFRPVKSMHKIALSQSLAHIAGTYIMERFTEI